MTAAGAGGGGGGSGEQAEDGGEKKKSIFKVIAAVDCSTFNIAGLRDGCDKLF